jgi:signal transduction histidine kinase
MNQSTSSSDDDATCERAPQHPLDLIPLFRRWPISPLRNLVYTAIWSTSIGLVLALAQLMVVHDRHALGDYVWPLVLIANIIGLLVHGSSVLCNLLFKGAPRRLRGLPRVAYHTLLVGACVVLGISIGVALLNGGTPWQFLGHRQALAESLLIALVFSTLMYLVRRAGDKRLAQQTREARQNEQIAATAQMLAEARLRALQAQIEPHFLYNTLANVVSLIGPQPARAQHMLERFIDYLRASLAASRQDRATLGAEADLAAAYLDVLAVRMGDRLRYRIEVPDTLRGIAVAPMLLQPLVENAISHGLEPKVEGGEVVLSAREQDGKLWLQVSDTGVGLTAAPARPSKPGGGVGLSNLRDRLRSLYGDEAQVQLLENQPSGVTVRLLLPLKSSPSSNPTTAP